MTFMTFEINFNIVSLRKSLPIGYGPSLTAVVAVRPGCCNLVDRLRFSLGWLLYPMSTTGSSLGNYSAIEVAMAE